MGGYESTPTIISKVNSQHLDLKNKGIRSLQFEPDDELTYKSIDLTGNFIQFLPYNLKNLAYLNLTSNGIQEFPKDSISIFKTYSELKTINLSYNYLIQLPKALESLPALENLICMNNRLISCDIKKCKLLHIDLCENQLSSIPNFHPSLKTLNLDLNKITQIDKGFPKLTRLCIGFNSVKSISPEITFARLHTLDISHNDLSELPNMQRITPNLERIDASFNKLTKIPDFPPSISELRFSNNSINEIPKCIKTYKSLVYMDFSCNRITKIPALPYVIQTLIAYDNEIIEIEECDTPDLRVLQISGNKLEQPPRYLINEITELSFFSNRLTSLLTECFYERIYKVDVSNNDLEFLPAELFKLSTLVHLNVSHNKIKRFPPSVASSPLIYFNFSENPIEKFPEILPTPLEQLCIAGCGLKKLPKSFIRNEELIELIASNNSLKQMPYIATLQKVNLSGNKFEKFPVFSKNIRCVDISHNLISTIPSLDFPQLYYLNLSHNNIKEFPDLKTSNLEYLLLRNNPIFNLPLHSLSPISRTDIDSPETFSSEILSIAQTPYTKIHFVDSIITNKSQTIFGFLNVGVDRAATTKAALSISERSDRGQSFEDIVDSTLPLLHADRTRQSSVFVLAQVSSSFVKVVRAGGSHAILFDGDGNVKAALRNPLPTQPRDRRSISLYRTADSLSATRALGGELLYGDSDDVAVTKLERHGACWLVLCSDFVAAAVGEERMSAIVASSKCADEISYALRNITIGNLYPQSITVITIRL